MDEENKKRFLNDLWDFYEHHKRDLPWRKPDVNGGFDFYKILVSELMLQQTQVDRVIPKFERFLICFPTIKSLAQASLSEVMAVWIGLGYNRRAKYVHDIAKQLYGKQLPTKTGDLTIFKGIGENTAAAVLTYTYDEPLIFIETNIRTVLFHYFFEAKENVSDRELEQLLKNLVDEQRPRDFYYAMMDFGTFLKSNGHAHSSKSKHYRKQSQFHGSLRQLRGEILRRAHEKQSLDKVYAEITDDRLAMVIKMLEQEGLISLTKTSLRIAD